VSPAGGVPVAAGVMFVQVLNPVTGRMEWAVRLEQDDAARSYADIAASGYSDMLHDEERVGARQMLLGGAVPYGMRGAVMRYGAVRCGAVRCGAVRCDVVRCSAVRCGAKFTLLEGVSLFPGISHAHRQNTAYRQAIRRAVRDRGGRTVLDIGTGTGLLALYATQAGAERAFACEVCHTTLYLWPPFPLPQIHEPPHHHHHRCGTHNHVLPLSLSLSEYLPCMFFRIVSRTS